MQLYVSTQGNDQWSGKLPSPNKKANDGPFATLERAREAVRSLKKAGKLPKGGVTVYLRGGLYFRDHGFELTAEDSGVSDAPIVYCAYRNEKVRLIGGTEIKGFQPVSDPAMLNRLPESSRGKVFQVDLKASGITDYGKLTRRGFGQPMHPAGLELFFQDKPMQLARYPNEGWLTIASVPAGQQGGKFTCNDHRLKRWANKEDIWVHGYWTWDWADSYEQVQSINPATGEITTVEPHGVYGYTASKRFYFLNVLEELDAPGEWYLDRKTGILYFYPPTSLKQGRVIVSLLEEPLISLKDVSYVTLRGLTIECTRGLGVQVVGGKHNVIAGCTLRNIGTAAIEIQDGTEHGVVSCDIYETGDGGILVSGGDRPRLTPAKHYVLNNHIFRFSRWSRTYRPAVLVNGVGIRIAHNLMHDAPHSAIILGGNDHLIEFNEIHHVCTDTGDAGAFYMGRDLTQRGTIIRYNYFHHLRGVQGQKGFIDVMAVYLDDCSCGTTVYGNLFYKAGRAAMIGGGRDNTIENNIFVDCIPAVHVDGRGLGWASFWFDGRDSTLMDRLKAMPYQQPPWSTRYPELVNILSDEPAVPKGNKIVRNLCVGGKWLELFDNLTDKVITFQDNLTEGDAGVTITGKRIQLRKDSPAYKLGFKPIPIEKIGLYKDQYRKVLP